MTSAPKEAHSSIMRFGESISMGIDLHRAVDAIPGLVWTAYSDGRIDFVNQRWCEYTGLSNQEASGEGWRAAVHPEDLPRLLESWESIVASGRPGEAEARLRRFDGVYQWFLFQVSPLIDAAGEIVKWCGINSDIETRKRAEAVLSMHEHCFQLIVDGLPAVMLLMGPDGELVHVNRHALEYAGVSFEELKTWSTRIHPDDRQATMASVKAAMASGEPYDAETRHLRADGTYRWFHSQGFPLKDNEGRPVLWYFFLTDIDDRKHAEALLAGEKRMLEMVAQGLPVLDALCELVEAIDNDCHAGILLLDHVGSNHFRRGGASPFAAKVVDELDGAPLTGKLGPCATAVITQSPMFVEDVASDPRWPSVWRKLSEATELRACWSMPIMSRTNETLGVFSIYRKAPGVPTQFQRDMMGRLAHLAAIAIERVCSDRALKRSEECWRAIVETTPECVNVVARDGTMLRVNSAIGVLLGVPDADALIGKCFYDFVAPEHRQAYIQFNQDVCEGRKGFLEFDIITVEGERSHMETHAAPMLGSDGGVVQLGVMRDITARKRASEELLRSAALMAKAQQLSGCGSFYWCAADDEIIWSDQLYRIFDITLGTRITLDLIATRVHPKDLHLMTDMVERSKVGENLEVDHRLLLPDGKIKYLHLEGLARRDSRGQVEYIGAIQDVTDRRESEEALSRLRVELIHVARVNSLGALTASIAHEINQPLAGIITNASTGLRMLGAKSPNIEGALETLRRTLRDGRRAAEVMTRLRALFSKKMISNEAVDLIEAVHEVAELLRSEIRSNRIAMRLEADDDIPIVTGDRVQLQQVILNLLINAVEAMRGVEDRLRQLLIRIEWDGGDQVRVAVSDTGVGIDPAQAAKLFDGFYSTKKEGMGIGLSVCRTIIESHGGRLWATPNRRHGATFSFCVPVQAQDNLGSEHADTTAHDGRTP
ncbi:PAS domain S-box protein [Dyella choica]|nr:PAS domain S-box protein [Dyella choica]